MPRRKRGRPAQDTSENATVSDSSQARAASGSKMAEIRGENEIWVDSAPYLYSTIIRRTLGSDSCCSVDWVPFRGGNAIGGSGKGELLVTSSGGVVRLVSVELDWTPASTADPPEELCDERVVFKGHGSISSARVAPRTPSLAATRTKKGAFVFRLPTGKDSGTAPSESALALSGAETTRGSPSLAWASDAKAMLSCETDGGGIGIWDASILSKSKTKPVSRFQGHRGGTLGLAWSAFDAARPLASCGADGCVRIWDSRAKKSSMEIKNAHSKPIRCVSWCALAEYLLASSSDDGSVALWDIRNLDQGKLFSLQHPGAVSTVAWGPRGRPGMVASGGSSRRVLLWDIESVSSEPKPIERGGNASLPPELVFIHGGHTATVVDVQWCPDREGLLASVDQGGSYQVWRPANVQMAEDIAEIQDVKQESGVHEDVAQPPEKRARVKAEVET